MLIILGRCLGLLALGGAAPEMVMSGGISSTHILFDVWLGANPRLAFVPNGLFWFLVFTWQVFSFKNVHRRFALVIETFLSSIFLSILDLAKLDDDCPKIYRILEFK